MTREEFGATLVAAGLNVIYVNEPIVEMNCAGQSANVAMRSLKTYNISEVRKFLIKNASVVFLYSIEPVSDFKVLRGNYITK
ncbi:hypothetical protein NCTGTJJY_CDS0236 [Serratia phage 92A1]|nr:hypothetical protein NCTGTJJY_CDS0236 [Serratia phage 92A1]